MAALAPMTELEAVNAMLLSIGQSPVNTLNVSGIRDVSIARMQLDTALRRTLARGWAFNTDEAYQLSPDIDGVILVPAGALQVKSDAADVTTRRHPTKGMALYDKVAHSFAFPAPLACTVVWAFAFEDIPQAARDYVAVVAARRFQSKAIGSQVLDRFEEEDEIKAWMTMEREERKQRKTNLLRGNVAISGFGNRSY